MAARVVMKKRKLDPDHSYLDLDDPMIKELIQYLPDALENRPGSIERLQPFLLIITKALDAENFTKSEKVRTLRVLIPI
jgi:hypothetical protein